MERKGRMPYSWGFRKRKLESICSYFVTGWIFSCHLYTITMSLPFTLILVFLQSEDYVGKQCENWRLRQLFLKLSDLKLFLVSATRQWMETRTWMLQNSCWVMKVGLRNLIAKPDRLVIFNSSCQSVKETEATVNSFHEITGKQKEFKKNYLESTASSSRRVFLLRYYLFEYRCAPVNTELLPSGETACSRPSVLAKHFCEHNFPLPGFQKLGDYLTSGKTNYKKHTSS